MGLGLRVDRWALMIVTAVVLGCHYFDQLLHVLGIASSVLSRRLSGMVEAGLLLAQADTHDARRTIYRLTPASRDLFGYLVCFSTWAAREYLHQPSSIRPVHKRCGQLFTPRIACSGCCAVVSPWDVGFETAASAQDGPSPSKPAAAKTSTPKPSAAPLADNAKPGPSP
jgi:DNA-binding HxlR family transcriptional regulator